MQPAEQRALIDLLASLFARRPALRRVVEAIVEGHSRKKAARLLGCSPHTIDWHLRWLYSQVDGLNAPLLSRFAIDALKKSQRLSDSGKVLD